MKKGIIQIYYGEGRGKSTAALGSAMMRASEGQNVTLIQFLKGKNESEQAFLNRLEPEIKVFRFAKQDAWFDDLSEEEQQEELLNLKNGFNYCKKVIATGGSDMIILDEVLGLLDRNVITFEELKDVLTNKTEDTTIICTGIVLDERLRDIADEIYNISIDI